MDHLVKQASQLSAARERLILALDFPNGDAALAFLSALNADIARESPPLPGASVLWVKVGLELFLAEGPRFVQRLTDAGYRVFLDLKLHDIPNTVARAVRTLLPLEPSLLTVHAAGGAAMLTAAAAAAAGSSTRLLAVTVLTSMDDEALRGVGVTGSAAQQVHCLARLAWASGIGGLVCSGQEVQSLRSLLPEVHLVTPGIRPAGAPAGDQQRVTTPTQAVASGAGQLVVGRPITSAVDPASAYLSILGEIAAALPPATLPVAAK